MTEQRADGISEASICQENSPDEFLIYPGGIYLDEPNYV